MDDIFDIIHKNITEESIMLYLKLCRHCQEKANKKWKGIVVKPMIFNEMNSRGQVDLIDMQTQAVKEYKWILNYQGHLTKFVQLRPLKKNVLRKSCTG